MILINYLLLVTSGAIRGIRITAQTKIPTKYIRTNGAANPEISLNIVHS